MAKRGPKPKPKGKLKRKRDYGLERMKTTVSKVNEGPDNPKAKWLRDYTDRMNATLSSVIWEDRQLEVHIPEDKPDRCYMDTALGKTTEIEIHSEVAFKLDLGDNCTANFRTDWTGVPRVWHPMGMVETVLHSPSPELYHQNWLPMERSDAISWIVGLLKPETLDILRTSRAYANLVNEASRFVEVKRQRPNRSFVEVPSNPKAARKFLKQRPEDILRKEFPRYPYEIEEDNS